MGRTHSSEYPKGTRAKRGSIQINFTWHGERIWLVLPLKDHYANFAKASKIRAELIQKAQFGILTAKDIEQVTGRPFKSAQEEEDTIIPSSQPTFAYYAQQYLYDLNDHTIGTKEKYLSILERIWMPLFAEMPIDTISSQMLRNAVNNREWSSAKVRNDALIPLRGTFLLAFDDEVIDKNPCDRLKNQKNKESIPDPFTTGERDLLLQWLKSQYLTERPVIYLYFKVAFWTGCRPSELIALTWQDVDMHNKQILINKGRVKGVDQAATKTKKERFVDLNEEAFDAFVQLRQLSYLKYDHVFICAETHEKYTTEQSLYKNFKQAMKATGVRYRPAYNARHTYATVCLMNGLNPVYVAAQLGHSLVMLMKRYARWINSDKNKEEIAKLSKTNAHPFQNGKLKIS
ncbi:tyrosine-type recombinase/integrase [Acinetobacter puyangensis]|uniref:tyrosine-type recombinase/integrase n=1 Tax=Acinetobacter puyangensis TaxID=1096779 RepID=UPI003A4D5CE4